MEIKEAIEILKDATPFTTKAKEALTFAIETLEKVENGRFVETEWISVKDKGPDENGLYLCLSNATRMQYVCRWNEQDWLLRGNEIYVSHWMPLPEPPKAKEGIK